MIGLQHWLRRAVPATPAELAATLWSFAYFFALLAGYYVLRPLRDQMGIAGGIRALPWLFTVTFVTLLAAQPLYGALVARVFFVWISVFNLVAVAVFCGIGSSAAWARRRASRATRAVSAGARLPRCPSCFAHPTCWASLPGSACCRSAQHAVSYPSSCGGGSGARRRRADARLCQHRPRSGAADAGDAGLCHRAAAQALWHWRGGGGAAGRVCGRLCGAGADIRPGRRRGAAGGTALNGLRHRQSGTPGVQVLQTLVGSGGRLIDTASSYGGAESVLGSVITSAALRDRVFLATNLEEPDAEELQRSLGRLRMTQVDLLQLHNVEDPRQSLAQLRAWEAQGLCRQLGAVLPQVPACRWARYGGHSRHLGCSPHGGQSGRHARASARRTAVPAHGRFRRQFVAGRAAQAQPRRHEMRRHVNGR